MNKFLIVFIKRWKDIRIKKLKIKYLKNILPDLLLEVPEFYNNNNNKLKKMYLKLSYFVHEKNFDGIPYTAYFWFLFIFSFLCLS